MKIWPVFLAILLLPVIIGQIVVDVRLVNLQVIVQDEQGRPIINLSKENFKIYEDDKSEQEVSHFDRYQNPEKRIAVLLDVSGSVVNKAEWRNARAREFIKSMLNEGNTRFMIAEFYFRSASEDNEEIRFAVPSKTISEDGWSDSYEEMRELLAAHLDMQIKLRDSKGRVIKTLANSFGTTLYDGIYFLSKEFDPVPDNFFKAAIILSDGMDNASLHNIHDATNTLGASQIIAYCISTSLSGEGFSILDDIAQSSGGLAFKINGARDLQNVFSQIGADLKSQYLISYKPRDETPGERKIIVKIIDHTGKEVKKYKVRHRKSYIF